MNEKQFPLIELSDLYHVGTMNKKQKRKNSHEGEGLSVSTEPQAWERINPFTSGERFSLEKQDNRFLNYHSLNETHFDEMIEWGEKNGWIQQVSVYTATLYDDELESDLVFACETKEEALSEVDGDEECVQEEEGIRMTKAMKCRAKATECRLNDYDLLAVLYAEDMLSVDGVWWEDVLDVSRYSAPRGVIFSSKLSKWTIRQLKNSKENINEY